MKAHHVSVVVLILLGAGCATATDDQIERNEGVLDGVEGQLRSEVDFERLTVGYSDSVGNSAMVVVDGYCGDCDEQELAEQAARAVWQSEVTPLRTLAVSVTDTVTSKRARRGGSVPADEEQLMREYGERPVPSLPDEE